jgi:hypothetical protein
MGLSTPELDRAARQKAAMGSEECLTPLQRFPLFGLGVKTSQNIHQPSFALLPGFAIEELWLLLVCDQEASLAIRCSDEWRAHKRV